MKKIVFYATVLAAAALMGACTEKEGMFNPEEKIAHIYQSNRLVMEMYNDATATWDTVQQEVSPKTLKETWSWDGNKLEKIELYSDNGEKKSTLEFTYEKKRVSRIEDAVEFVTFTYKDKNIEKAEVFYKDINPLVPYDVYTFTYSGDKVVKIEVVSRGSQKGLNAHGDVERVLLQALLPDTRVAERILASRHGVRKGEERQEIVLEWNGNNISRMTIKEGETAMSAAYTYDDKRNPYSHFVATVCGIAGSELMAFANENNVTKMVLSVTGGETDEVEQTTDYTYTYTGEWPETCTSHDVYDADYVRTTEIVTKYFEYKK